MSLRSSILAVFFMLIGCGTAQNDFAVVTQVWNRVTSPQQQSAAPADIATIRAGLTPAVLAEIGEPVLIAQVPSRDAVALLLRVGSNDGVDTFLAPDGISISLRDGMIVATRGLGFDLMTADVAEPLAAIAQSTKSGVRIHRYLDGENQLVMRSFACDYQAAASGQTTETCQSTGLSFVNSHTLGANGKIAASQQWVSPQIGTILIELIE